MTDSLYLTVDQVAARFNTSVSSIWRWKREGYFTKAVKLGPGGTRWRLSDVEAWEATREMCFMFAMPFGPDEPFGGST